MKAWLIVMLNLALTMGCARYSAKIPAKAARDLSCAEPLLAVRELGQGDRGRHLVSGCGRKATYEVNPLGDWVLVGPISYDPSYVRPASP